MKRLAIGIVAVAAMALSLAGCSTSNTPTGKPSLLLWVDTPRVPQAQAYKKLMAGKEDIKIEVIAQADAQTKISLHNRTKSGWPDVIFGTAADTAAANEDEAIPIDQRQTDTGPVTAPGIGHGLRNRPPRWPAR